VEARYFDPAIGMFRQVDPIADLMPDISVYAYCNNTPINFSDPMGLAPEGSYAHEQMLKWEARYRASFHPKNGSPGFYPNPIRWHYAEYSFTKYEGGDQVIYDESTGYLGMSLLKVTNHTFYVAIPIYYNFGDWRLHRMGVYADWISEGFSYITIGLGIAAIFTEGATLPFAIATGYVSSGSNIIALGVKYYNKKTYYAEENITTNLRIAILDILFVGIGGAISRNFYKNFTKTGFARPYAQFRTIRATEVFGRSFSRGGLFISNKFAFKILSSSPIANSSFDLIITYTGN
jgi:hypothetical protein